MGYEKRYTTLLFEMLEKIHASETQSHANYIRIHVYGVVLTLYISY